MPLVFWQFAQAVEDIDTFQSVRYETTRATASLNPTRRRVLHSTRRASLADKLRFRRCRSRREAEIRRSRLLSFGFGSQSTRHFVLDLISVIAFARSQRAPEDRGARPLRILRSRRA